MSLLSAKSSDSEWILVLDGKHRIINAFVFLQSVILFTYERLHLLSRAVNVDGCMQIILNNGRYIFEVDRVSGAASLTRRMTIGVPALQLSVTLV